MKHLKTLLCAALALALCAALLFGCADASSADASSAASGSASASDSAAAPDSASDSTGEDAPEEALDFSAGLDESGFIAGVTALDYVTLPADYAAIPVPAEEVAVGEDELQEQLDTIAAQYAQPEQITDRAVADNEYVNIDYSGSMDGEVFDGGTASGQRVLSGSAQFIDDFLTQIIGHMPGETFDVEVTFPDPYENNPDFAGKDAVFEVTINYIEGEDVVPALDDAFVQENFSSYGWQTAEDLRSALEEDMRSEKLSNFVWDYLVENAQISEVPQAVIDFQTATLLNLVRSDAQMYGVSVEDYLQGAMGIQDEDALLKAQAESIEEGARQLMIFQAIAEDTAFSTDDDAIAAYFEANMGSADYTMYEETFGRPYLCLVVSTARGQELIQNGAVVG